MAFRRVISDASKGLMLKPVLHSYLFNARFPSEFMVQFRGYKMNRSPDGVFHPSTHPLWSERMLWMYLTHPDQMVSEDRDYMSTLSVTMGTSVHSFMEMCATDAGVRLDEEQMLAEGWDVRGGEPYFEDLETRAAGQGDGLLSLPFPGIDRQVWEFKTTNAMLLRKIKDLDLDQFKEMWPDYWAQQQEYMRLSGLKMAVVLMMQLGYPWEMREFHIPADPMIQGQIAGKYRRVIEAVESGEMPEQCCPLGSSEAKSCPARRPCPVGVDLT